MVASHLVDVGPRRFHHEKVVAQEAKQVEFEFLGLRYVCPHLVSISLHGQLEGGGLSCRLAMSIVLSAACSVLWR